MFRWLTEACFEHSGANWCLRLGSNWAGPSSPLLAAVLASVGRYPATAVSEADLHGILHHSFGCLGCLTA